VMLSRAAQDLVQLAELAIPWPRPVAHGTFPAHIP
jgi:hypothetical protein